MRESWKEFDGSDGSERNERTCKLVRCALLHFAHIRTSHNERGGAPTNGWMQPHGCKRGFTTMSPIGPHRSPLMPVGMPNATEIFNELLPSRNSPFVQLFVHTRRLMNHYLFKFTCSKSLKSLGSFVSATIQQNWSKPNNWTRVLCISFFFLSFFLSKRRFSS